jgi:hypothetical protein
VRLGAGRFRSGKTGGAVDASRDACLPRRVSGLLPRFCLAVALGGSALAAGLEWTAGPGFRSAPVKPVGTGRPGFTALGAADSGLNFANVLAGDAYLTNAVAHNGAGVAIGDVDADGWADVYLCSLQGPNRLFRNLGNWKFQELPLAGAAGAGQFSTGAALADVDGDADLDLLVNGIATGTRLFLNDGQGRFTEGTDTGFSRTASATSLALADVDGDGDLDLYCPHFIDVMMLSDPTTKFALARQGDQWVVAKVNGESARSPRWKGRFEAFPDGRIRELPEVHGFYRNDGGGHFKAMEAEPGVYEDETGKPIPPFRDWGLAAMFRDLNGDGRPDLYVCNDNTSPDRIWINRGGWHFRALDTRTVRHTSRSAMGIDFGDLNRDGRDDFFVVDMLARDHAKRLTQLMRDRPVLADGEEVSARPQFNRNTLYFGRADGSFAETALMAGLAATDWTWTALFLDVDLDGYEDILVTNGFEFDVMDQDSHAVIRDGRRKLTEAQLKRSMQFHPRWRTPNAAFRNRGDGTFTPMAAAWGFDHVGISYGAATGDLDNDGDLDLVVNHLNEPAGLYRNDAGSGRVQVRLRGTAPNTAGIGAKVRLVGPELTQSQDILAGGRYLSGDQAARTFAAPSGQPLRLEIRWPSGRECVVTNVEPDRIYEVSEPVADPVKTPVAPKPSPLFEDLSGLLQHEHIEEPFDDWSRQAMLPKRLSRLGPGMAWFDADGDGWEDLLIGSGKGGALAVFLNEQGRGFKRLDGLPTAGGDLAGIVGWPDGKGGRHLLAAVANYERVPDGESELQVFTPGRLDTPLRLPAGPASVGAVALADVDGDGDLDAFVGGRFQPGRYPEPVSSTVWLNDGDKLTSSAAASEPFKAVGLVNGATFADLDGDGATELVLALEWGPLKVFRAASGRFRDVTAEWGLADFSGWWTGVAAGDFDGDGRLDLVAGNWGRNTIYELNQPTAFRAWYGEWNDDGVVQLVEAWNRGAEWFPVRDRAWLERGFPRLTDRFPTHEAFAQATLKTILGPRFVNTRFVAAQHLESMVFLNRGGRFEAQALPVAAQVSPVFSVNVADVDGDGVEDVFCAQNFFGTATDMSRDDNGRGLWLRGLGGGRFAALEGDQTGLEVLGEQRGAALADFNHDGRVDVAVSQNGTTTRLYANRSGRPGLRVTLAGPPGNPKGIGAQLRMQYAGNRLGPVRSVSAGTGYWSHDAATQVLGLAGAPVALWVGWPGGREQTLPLTGDQREVRAEFKP